MGLSTALEPPAALLDAVDARCRELSRAAVGRVFELPGEAVEAAVRRESQDRARYDTILSFVRLHSVADLPGLVAVLETILAEDGWIHMVEPCLGSAGGGPPSSLPARRFARRAHKPGEEDRDVVSALRSGGFMITDLYRCEATSAPAAWRHYVQLRARRKIR